MNATATIERTGQSRCTGNFSADEREHLILEHLPQVRMLARKIHARLPENVSLDDLESTGVLGLISAVDHFDPTRHVHLGTYAEHKIKGGILDSLRKLDWAPRQQRKRAKQIEAAIAAAKQRLHRVPTEEEIAGELKLTVDRYRDWQLNARAVNLGRLESAGRDSEDCDLLRFVSGDSNEWPLAQLERSELHRVLAGAIAQLPPMEKTVLSLYFYQELTLREISKIVGLHESRISQLKSQAVLNLRASMTKVWPCTGEAAALRRKPEDKLAPARRRLTRRPAATEPQYSAQAC